MASDIATHRFDLNQVPDEIEFNNSNVEFDEDVDAVKPYVIDLNVDSNQQSEYPTSLDLNIDYLHEEVDSNANFEEEYPAALHSGNVSIPQKDHRQRKRDFLSNEQRWAIYTSLLKRSVNGKLKRNMTREVASMFPVSLRTVQRIWKRAKDTPYGAAVDVSHKKTKNCGRKRIQIVAERYNDHGGTKGTAEKMYHKCTRRRVKSTSAKQSTNVDSNEIEARRKCPQVSPSF